MNSSTDPDAEWQAAEEEVGPVTAAEEQAVVEAIAESVAEKVAAAGTTISPELQAVLLAMQQQTLMAIAEMRKPDAETQEKKDEEKVRSMQLTMARVNDAKKQEAGKATRIAQCSHMKRDGLKSNLRGQVHSNNYAKAVCGNNCGYVSGWFAALPHEINGGGLNISEWGQNAFAIVESRVRNSTPPPPIPDVPFGASITFN